MLRVVAPRRAWLAIGTVGWLLCALVYFMDVLSSSMVCVPRVFCVLSDYLCVSVGVPVCPCASLCIPGCPTSVSILLLCVPPVSYQVEAFNPHQCPHDDVWPCPAQPAPKGRYGGGYDRTRIHWHLLQEKK